MRLDTKQLEFIHHNLRGLLLWLEQQTLSGSGHELMITSLYRINSNGVHGCLPLRGADIRCREEENGKRMVDMINGVWEYDPDRPNKQVALLHGEGWNMHIHLQVHKNTWRRAHDQHK